MSEGAKVRRRRAHEELVITAYHKAGHAVIAHALRYEVIRATIRRGTYGPDGIELAGHVKWICPEIETTKQAYLATIPYFAGPLAHSYLTGIHVGSGSQGDFDA